MWWELICGIVLYKLFKKLFCGQNDDVLDIPSSSDANVLFSVAKRLEKVYGGAKVFVGLQIPDPDSGSRQNIDLVLLLDGEATVISVKHDISGFVTIDKDGTWVCTGSHKHQTVRIPNPVTEAQHQISVLESYLQQRGLDLPPAYISYKVICPNPNFHSVNPGSFPPEVVTHEQFAELKSETKNALSGWMKNFRRGKKDMQESLSEKLNLVLSTAPVWDRLQLKGDKYILGEFLEFKGKQDDVQELRNIRRSKVGRLIIQKTSMFGLAPSKLEVVYTPQDYRGDGSATSSDFNEVTVRSSTEIVFQPRHSTKVRKYKLSSVISMTLSP
ncbi:hypothetical protein Leryth_004628 [Lithospermum erythrorhizon]|nr:hypothetical protein Leryth_004628 [Lithospermum erythrorhizon]